MRMHILFAFLGKPNDNLSVQETEEFVAEGELSSIKPEKKKSKRWYNRLIDIFFVSLIVVSLSFTTSVLVVEFTYNLPFYVNGMSMFPTLNANCLDAQGKPLTFHSGSVHAPGYEAEYGYAKSGDHGKWWEDVHRYDIIITMYPDDFQKDSNGDYIRDEQGKLQPISGRKSKIKRVIGMPGETIILETVKEDDPNGMYNRIWGKTTVIHPNGESEVLKPLYTLADYPSTDGVPYNYPSQPVYNHVTLKDNEYFVMGDNRGYSSDSRQKGPVTMEMMSGKAYFIVGKEVMKGDNPTVPVYRLMFPWTFRRLN